MKNLGFSKIAFVYNLGTFGLIISGILFLGILILIVTSALNKTSKFNNNFDVK
jgi:hypothetical protein